VEINQLKFKPSDFNNHTPQGIYLKHHGRTNSSLSDSSLLSSIPSRRISKIASKRENNDIELGIQREEPEIKELSPRFGLEGEKKSDKDYCLPVA